MAGNQSKQGYSKCGTFYVELSESVVAEPPTEWREHRTWNHLARPGGRFARLGPAHRKVVFTAAFLLQRLHIIPLTCVRFMAADFWVEYLSHWREFVHSETKPILTLFAALSWRERHSLLLSSPAIQNV